jgi:hypothetical protein
MLFASFYRSREEAEEFIVGNPFVTAAAVAEWRIVEWQALYL